MPCISDPGEDLVRLCAENGVDIKVIPGPSAAISALAVSGLDTSRFVFEGFLNPQKNARLERLEQLKSEQRTLIFYEAPHKLTDTLEAMLQVLGDRKISLARELTKIYEEVVRTTLSRRWNFTGKRRRAASLCWWWRAHPSSRSSSPSSRRWSWCALWWTRVNRSPRQPRMWRTRPALKKASCTAAFLAVAFILSKGV